MVKDAQINCIPTQDTIHYMAQILRNKVNPTTLTEFTNLVKVCLKHNVCQFRGTTYQFPDGLPMGGQLSGTDELKEFLASMNQFHQNVKFTMELGGHKINFLDLTVSLYTRNCISTPCFEIFCKNTFTDVSIHNDSYHLRQHKMAVLHAAIHRLLSIPLDREAHEHEIRLIEEVGKINVLKVNVRELIRRKSVRKLLPENRDNPPKENRRKWVRLPYLWKTFDKIGKELNCLNYRTAFYPVSEVAQLLTIKDAVLENQKAGIYEFRCNERKAI